MWTKETLKQVIKEKFQNYHFVIVSNREPYFHTYDKNGEIVTQQTIGGVSITFDSIMRITRGTWVAYGGSEADRLTVDKHDHIKVPIKNSKYTLRRVWMTTEERLKYYEGFSNGTIWPLCHVAFIRPKFSQEDWQVYKKINKRFADAVLEEIKDQKAVVWIQDYHFALLAKYIKEKRPDVAVAQFWHIPWPTFEIFRICPWKNEILSGLLKNDLFGFHRYYQTENFLRCIGRELEANINMEELSVKFQKHQTQLGFFPISVDYHQITEDLKGITTEESHREIKKFVKTDYSILAVGVDRVDYTKGIINRLQAIEHFLTKYLEYQGKLTYLGIGAPSRTGINTYRELNEQIKKEVKRINEKFTKNNWQPIVYINQPVLHDRILKIFKAADICLVTALDDGMNLVCKEYVVANNNHGSLILSAFVGAAKELAEAFIVNPYDIYEIADAIKKAIDLNPEIKKEKMIKMKAIIENNNVYRWAGKFLTKLSDSTKQ